MTHVVLVGLLLGALALRLWLVLSHPGYLGVDGGAYVLHAQNVQSFGIQGLDFPRPPLAPGWQLVPWINIFGIDLGYKLWQAFASLLLPMAFRLLAGRFLTPWQATFATAFVAFDLFHAEMLVTGVLPLIGFSILLVVLWGIIAIEERKLAQWAIMLGIPLLAHANATVTGIAAILLQVFVLGFWAFGGWVRIREALAPMIMGGAVAMTALPWYIGLAPGSAATHYEDSRVLLFTLQVVIIQLVPIAIVATAVFWPKQRNVPPEIRALGLMLLAGACLLPWFSVDETLQNIFYRTRYFVEIPLVLLTAWLVSRHFLPYFRPVVVGIALAVLFLMPAGYAYTFHGQASRSDMVTQDGAAALTYIEAHPKPGIILTNAGSLSLWTSAIIGVKSHWLMPAKPPVAYAESDAYFRCVMGWATCGEPTHQVGYVLLETRFQDSEAMFGFPTKLYGRPDTGAWDTAYNPPNFHPVFERGTVRVWARD